MFIALAAMGRFTDFMRIKEKTMITVEEFIKNQAKERAHAASLLREPLEINGISIAAGSTKDGICVSYGIEILAKMLEVDVITEVKEKRVGWVSGIRYFNYNDCRFYQSFYEPKGETSCVEM